MTFVRQHRSHYVMNAVEKEVLGVMRYAARYHVGVHVSETPLIGALKHDDIFSFRDTSDVYIRKTILSSDSRIWTSR